MHLERTVYSLLVSKRLALLSLVPLDDQSVSESERGAGVGCPAMCE